MTEQTEQAARTDVSPLRSWIIRHPILTFLVLVYATTTALVFVPRGPTEPGLLPGGATPHGILENVLGSAAPAFIVTALVSGKAGVRDLARRSFRWRVPLRWYLISLLAPLLILLIAITILYGLAPLRALAIAPAAHDQDAEHCDHGSASRPASTSCIDLCGWSNSRAVGAPPKIRPG